jgi:cation-transporting ATPase E
MRKHSTTGLTAAEVAVRVARGEVNRVPRSDRAAYAEIAARNLLTLFNALVVPAAIALFVLGEYRDGLAVSGMAVANAVLGLTQEIRAKRHLDRLALLAETQVRVVRDGAVTEIPSGDVVRGDLVLLGAGDSVVADGELVEARYLEIDEALLTGESDPVPRNAGDRVQSGSFAVVGEGRYVADGVGADAYAQRTAAEARKYRFAASPLQQSIDRLIRILTTTAVVLCVAYVFLWSSRGFAAKDLVQMIAATITSMVPQGLVLMATLAFVLGAVRMAARGAIVQRLSAVETMAAIDTLCMDKTGTLTTNNLQLERLVVLDAAVGDAEVRRRLRLFACASLDRGSKSLAALRSALGEGPAELLDQVPFKSQNRYSAVRARDGAGEHALALGAPEALAKYLHPDGAAAAEAARAELTKTGLRLLLFTDAAGPGPFAGSLEGFALRPLALAALSDEVRPEAGSVLRELAGQAIEFKILSGDNPETVRATVTPLGSAPELRALADGPVVTGAELEAAVDPVELVARRCIFGRVTPWQKVQVVAALKDAGRHVAMIGDGVNDVLPIKNAHLGIAMGDGTQAAKTVSGIVLTTNRFDLLPATLEEGRTILRNLRRAGKIFLVKNVYTLILIVGALGVFDLSFPYLPRQVTLLNFLTIGMPVVLITFGRERAGAARSDFVREVGLFALGTGVVIGAAGLALQWHSARVRGEDAATQRTLLLTALVLLGLATLLRALGDGESRRVAGDRWFYVLAAGALALYLAVMYFPPTATFFALEPLTADGWLRVLAAVVPAVATLMLLDLASRRAGRRADPLRAGRA